MIFELIVLFLLFTTWLYMTKDYLGLFWHGLLLTAKGCIQVNCQNPGLALVIRSPREIRLVIFTPWPIMIFLPRTIPSSSVRIEYIVNDIPLSCPYELGPALHLPKGKLRVLQREKAGFGRWKTIGEYDHWPIQSY